MNHWRHTKLLVSLIALLISRAELAQADENQPLNLRNDLSTPIDLYIASEKSQQQSPWHHFQLDAGQNQQVTMSAPDRYFVVLQIGNQRSKSKPLELKKFVSEHPNYVMRVSEIMDTSIGASATASASSKPPKIGASVSPDPNAPNPSGTWASLPVEFENYDGNDQSIWSLSPDSVTLKLHNDLDDQVDVYIASKKNESPNPWTHLQIQGNGDDAIILKSPDPFLIRVDVGSESARSKPVELKSFLANHKDYVLNVGRSYQAMMAGAPEGGGGGDEKPPPLKATVVPDPQRQSSNVATPPAYNPDPMSNLGGAVKAGSNDSGQLSIEWE